MWHFPSHSIAKIAEIELKFKNICTNTGGYTLVTLKKDFRF